MNKIKQIDTKLQPKFRNEICWCSLQICLLFGFLLSLMIIIYQHQQLNELKKHQSNLCTTIIKNGQVNNDVVMAQRMKRSNNLPKSPLDLTEDDNNPLDNLITSSTTRQPAPIFVPLQGNTNPNEQSMFFPLFIQFSAQQIENVCRLKYGGVLNQQMLSSNHYETVDETQREMIKQKEIYTKEKMKNENRTKYRSKVKLFRNHKEKVCAPIKAISVPRLVGERIHKNGAIMRRGDYWLLTEFKTGNTLFQFDSGSDEEKLSSDPFNKNSDDTELKYHENEVSLKENFDIEQIKSASRRSIATSILKYPTMIHTLAEPFYGTDHTVSNFAGELVFYYVLSNNIPHSGGLVRIQALHLTSGRRTTKLLSAATGRLYGGMEETSNDYTSAIDLEVDQSALWALYRRPNKTTLSVSKLSMTSLKELTHWKLSQLEPQRYLNAFVSCSILYVISTDEVLINPEVNNVNEEQNNETNVLDYNSWRHRRNLYTNYQSGTKNDTIVVAAVFDFLSGQYINPPRIIDKIILDNENMSKFSEISNAQYDAISDSINVFNSGKLFSILLKRKRS